MKKVLRLWGLMALASLLSLSACEEKDSNDSAVDLSFSAAEFMLADLDALAKPRLQDGCDKKLFSIGTIATAKTERQALSYILPQLKLQANQANSIHDFARTHHKATSTHVGSISIIHQLILEKGNNERNGYLNAYNQGQLSKAQLDSKLEALYSRVTDELQRHEQKQTHLQVLHSERQALVQNIESVLEPAQLAQWNNWKLNYSN